MVLVFLAHGFEEIEALTVVDVLRRAEIETLTVGIGSKTITGAHGITVHCDKIDREISKKNLEAIVLPGGMPGTTNLDNAKIVHLAIDYCNENQKLIAAICAAPLILSKKGLLSGKKATVFPGNEHFLEGAELVNSPIVTDANFITGNGPASALLFSLEIVKYLRDEKIAKQIGEAMQCPTTD